MNNSTAKAKPKMTVKNGVVYGDALSAQEKKRIVMQKKKDRKAKKVRKSAQQTMQEIFDETTDCVIKLMKDVNETFRVRKQEAAEDDADTVTIAKEDYETMIDDLLTMSEIIQCVADMRTQDVKAIREFGKFVPAFAAFEKNRLSLYREAAKEAEEIFDRWADEIDDLDEDFMEDEDYEPDEYYSD